MEGRVLPSLIFGGEVVVEFVSSAKTFPLLDGIGGSGLFFKL